MLSLLLHNLRIALHEMMRRPFRTFLVLQGMVWGSAVAIMPPALIKGSQQTMLERASSVGTDRVILTSDPMDASRALTLEDFRHVEERFGDSLKAAAPFRAQRAVFRRGGKTATGWVVGTTPRSLEARGLSLRSGRFFRGEGEAALEPGLASVIGGEGGIGDLEIFPLPADAGRTDVAALQGKVEAGEAEGGFAPLRVSGVLSPLPASLKEINDFGVKRNHFLSNIAADLMRNMGVEVDTEPWRREGRSAHVSLDLLAREAERIDMVILKAKPEAVMDLVEDLQKDLSSRGRIPLIRWNLLAPVFLKGGMERYTRLRYATFVLCLVMGAVVITNVMLFFVLENYREIAVRRVEGATKSDIVVQYLAHAMILSVTGGLLGLPTGMLVAKVRIWLAPQAAMGLVFPWGSAALVVGATILAGGVAGVLPALRASGLDPVEALRNE